MEYSKELEEEYKTLYSGCKVRPEKVNSVKWYADRIQRAQARYENVAKKTGVPWHVIAVIHAMESTMDFGTHLHNGDPLDARTVNVPAGRPKTHEPPFTWEESAVDALGYDGATNIRNWDLPHTLYFLEGYNGWGYRTGKGQATTPAKRSAYLWSFTNQYEKGRYVKDGEFDPNSVSDQAGCCAILKTLEERGLIDLGSMKPPVTAYTEKDVGWFELYDLSPNELGIAAKIAGKDDTFAVQRLQCNVSAFMDFKERFLNARNHVWADEQKKWPGDSVKPPVVTGFSRTRLVEIALAQTETDISWRGNGLAKKYTKIFESEFGTGRFPWCAAFVSWCCREAGLNLPMRVPGDKDNYTFALCEAWQQWGKRMGFWYDTGTRDVETGDIVLFDWDGAVFPDNDYEDHIGIVYQSTGRNFINVKTVEGNVDDKTAKKLRERKVVQGFIAIPDGFKFS